MPLTLTLLVITSLTTFFTILLAGEVAHHTRVAQRTAARGGRKERSNRARREELWKRLAGDGP